MSKIKIALVDDQQLFRQSLAALIAGFPDFELVASTGGGEAFLDIMRSDGASGTLAPDVLLMDMEMPGMDGIALQEQLRKLYPSLRIIVLSVHARERLIARMITAGSSGYLIKNCDKEELAAAIRSVYESGFYINAQVLKAIQHASSQRSTLTEELSAREKEVLRLICKEYSNADIAKELFISIRTAEGHRNNLLAKTGCANTAGLVLFAVKHHIYEVVY